MIFYLHIFSIILLIFYIIQANPLAYYRSIVSLVQRVQGKGKMFRLSNSVFKNIKSNLSVLFSSQLSCITIDPRDVDLWRRHRVRRVVIVMTRVRVRHSAADVEGMIWSGCSCGQIRISLEHVEPQVWHGRVVFVVVIAFNLARFVRVLVGWKISKLNQNVFVLLFGFNFSLIWSFHIFWAFDYIIIFFH